MMVDEAVLDAYDKEPVFYNIYAYYDTLTKLFNMPLITEQEPALVVAGAKSAYLKDEAARVRFTGLQLCMLGRYECREGKFLPTVEPVVICDFSKIKVEDKQLDA